MRARFDGTCVKCGEPIKGFINHPSTFDDIAWTRKPRPDGLDRAAWHSRCNALPDNPATVAMLLERQERRKGHEVSTPIFVPAVSESIPDVEPVTVAPYANPSDPAAMLSQLLKALNVDSTVISAVTSAVKKVETTPKVAPKALTTRSPWYDVFNAVLEAGMTRVLLVGPPGTGKSTTADKDNLRVTCHEDAGPESMVGTFIQKDGNTIWIDGPCIIAMKQGKTVVLDEIDHTSPECVSLLYALIDDKPSIMLPTGEYVQAAKGYRVICTSNANPSDLPDAILDRIESVICADTPHPLAVDNVKALAGSMSTALSAVMLNYYRGLSTDVFRWRGNPTLRKCRNFSKLVSAGMNSQVAAKVVFGQAGPEILSALTTAAVK